MTVEEKKQVKSMANGISCADIIILDMKAHGYEICYHKPTAGRKFN